MHADAAVVTREPQVYFDHTGDEFAVAAGEQPGELEAQPDVAVDAVLDTTVVPPDDDATSTAFEGGTDGRADHLAPVEYATEIVGRATDEPDSEGQPRPGEITVRTLDGDLVAGPATSDTDGDGTADTVVVTDPGGDTVLYTDADGDGVADLATEITVDGQVVVSEYVGNGEWAVLERIRLGEPDAEGGDGATENGWHTAGTATVSVDPATGLWVRR